MTMQTPDRLAPENIRMILSSWMERHNAESFPWITDPKMVEVSVCAPLFEADNNICICGHKHDDLGHAPCKTCTCPRWVKTIYHVGKLDLLGRLRSEPAILCPVDHKTTGKIDGRFVQQFTLDSQMSGYLYDASHLSGKPVNTCFINAIEFSVVPTSTRKCPLHGVPYEECGPSEHIKYQVIGPIERTDRQIAQWKETAIGLAIRYHRLCGESLKTMSYVRQDGTFNGSCGFCEFREYCLADRAPKQVPLMYEQRAWSPVEHVFGPKGLKKSDPLGLYVDNSILAATARCSTQALMRYALNWTNAEQTGPLGAGTAAHKCLEIWFQGGTEKEALEAFDNAYAIRTA